MATQSKWANVEFLEVVAAWLGGDESARMELDRREMERAERLGFATLEDYRQWVDNAVEVTDAEMSERPSN